MDNTNTDTPAQDTTTAQDPAPAPAPAPANTTEVSSDQQVIDSLRAQISEKNTKLSEFRNNNISLDQKVKEMNGELSQYKEAGVDVDTIKTYKEFYTNNVDKVQSPDTSKENVTETIRKSLESQAKGFTAKLQEQEQKVQDLASERDFYKNIADTNILKETILKEVAYVGKPKENAVNDIVARAQKVFVVENGELIARNPDGSVMMQEDRITPQSPEAWAKELYENADYFFYGNTGGGASGSTASSNTNNVSGTDANGIITITDTGDVEQMNKVYTEHAKAISEGRVRFV